MVFANKDIKSEEYHLDNVYIKINDLYTEENAKLRKLTEHGVGYCVANEYSEGILFKELKTRFIKSISNLEVAKKRPYFARCDFNSYDFGENSFYIGRTHIRDSSTNEIIIYDWRTPVANLFYDCEIGRTSYTSPLGNINGVLELKRQYEIKNNKLINIYDIDIVGSQISLEHVLGRQSNKKMQDIIATIQKEQNLVIREEMYSNLIIQGIAGSGKTSILLHRISYLLYNFQNKISSDDFIVFAPNKLFLSYIDNVLPDLCTERVTQTTFDGWVDLCIFEEGYEFNKNYALTYKENYIYECYKYISNYINNHFRLNDIIIGSKIIISYKEMIQFLNVNSAINGLIPALKDLKKYIFKKIKRLNQYGTVYMNRNKVTIMKAKREITKYISNFNLPNMLSDFISSSIVNFQCKKREVPYEFRYSFLILYKFLYGKLPIKSDYKIVIIDEAQDYPHEVFSFICKTFNKSMFNLAGDMMQSINFESNMTNWMTYKDILSTETKRPVKIHYLRVAYRTTNQIAQLAKKISDRYLDEKSCIFPIEIRDGSDPVCFIFSNFEEEIKCINSIIAQFDVVGSVAIIDKDYKHLLKLEREITGARLLKSDSSQIVEGVMLMDPYCAKGLEFDSVIIPNIDHFDNSDFFDDKLLYISITRALHNLYIGRNQ